MLTRQERPEYRLRSLHWFTHRRYESHDGSHVAPHEKTRIERNLAFPSEEFRARVRTAAKQRGFRTEQAFLLAACEHELERVRLGWWRPSPACLVGFLGLAV